MKVTTNSTCVVDWEQKLRVCRRLLGAANLRDFVEAVLARTPRQHDHGVTQAIVDSARRWHLHWPKKYPWFFEMLARKLQCREDVTGLDIIESSFAEFLDLLPPEKRDKVVRAQIAGVQSHDAEQREPDLAGRHIRINVLGPDVLVSLTHGVRNGHLDTRHYYSSADAAEAWSRLISAQEYPTYDQCRLGLARLVEDERWHEAVRASQPSTLVMLAGGGSPTKDMVLIKSVLQHRAGTHRVHVVLVDIAFYMICQSLDLIEEALTEMPGHERVRVEGVVDDVLLLNEQTLFRRAGRAVFAITGGTIGNLNELKFFQSLARVAKPGDLLIVSADTVDDMPPAQIEEVLSKKYGHSEMRRFIAPGMRAVIDYYKLRESLEEAEKRVRPKVVHGAEALQFTTVPKSTCVTVVMNAGKKEVVLVSSTRYSVEAFQSFAAQQGWSSVCVVASPLNPHFVQMVFRRNAVG